MGMQLRFPAAASQISNQGEQLYLFVDLDGLVLAALAIKVAQPHALEGPNTAQTSAANVVFLRELQEQGNNIVVLIQDQRQGLKLVFLK